MRLPTLLTMALLLSGCTSYVWVKPVGDPATFAPDSYTCTQEATTAAPPLFYEIEVFPRRDTGPDIVRTRCVQDGPTQTCHARYYAPNDTLERTTIRDLNEKMRGDLYNSCMQAKGWILQAVEDQ